MRGSFSFQGIDINTFGLTYVPEASNIYVYDKSNANLNTRVFDGHHGGYYFGATMQPKVFNLRCYFEDNNINNGFMSKVISFFKIGNEGRLVFDSRPYIYYNVIVTGVDNTRYVNQRNGYVTINFTAFYPFGRTDIKYLESSNINNVFNSIYVNGIVDNILRIPAGATSAYSNSYIIKNLEKSFESESRWEKTGNTSDNTTISKINSVEITIPIRANNNCTINSMRITISKKDGTELYSKTVETDKRIEKDTLHYNTYILDNLDMYPDVYKQSSIVIKISAIGDLDNETQTTIMFDNTVQERRLQIKERTDSVYITTDHASSIIKNTAILTKDRIATGTFYSGYIVYVEDNNGLKQRLYPISPDKDYKENDMYLYMNEKRYTDQIRYRDKILLYNGGNEPSNMSIKITPLQNLTIVNTTNNSFCKLINIDNYLEKYAGKNMYIDCINGNVYIEEEDGMRHAFLYHDSGFITLDPSMPIKRNIQVSYNGRELTSDNGEFTYHDEGKFIYLEDAWNKIASVIDERNAILEIDTQRSNACSTEIIKFNEIDIIGEDKYNDEYDSIEFIYNHTFS